MAGNADLVRDNFGSLFQKVLVMQSWITSKYVTTTIICTIDGSTTMYDYYDDNGMILYLYVVSRIQP